MRAAHPAVDATLFNPEAVAVAPDGDLLIMDDGNGGCGRSPRNPVPPRARPAPGTGA
jgi:hypothetical protein